MIPVMPSALSRRALLRAVVVGTGALLLTACDDADREDASPTDGVRPDDPATWPPDTQLFVTARQRIHGYRLALDVVGDRGRTARQLDELWALQQERLELLITLGGVPLPELRDAPAVSAPPAPGHAAATSSPGPGDPSGRTGEATDATGTPPSTRPEARDLGIVVRADHTQACRELATATPANAPMLASLVAQHVASAAALEAPVDWDVLAGPAGTAAVPVLDVARPAVFGLEVVAARSDGEERADYESVLGPLRAMTRHLETLAGEAAPVPPLGYDLPESLGTRDRRRDLAQRLVADVAPAALDATQRLRGDIAQLRGVVRIVSDTVAWGRTLGADVTPFPGMTLP